MREPSADLDWAIGRLSARACAGLLGLPEEDWDDEKIDLAEARRLVREAYCHGSLDATDIVFR
jgi:hypothetical protein